MVIYENAHKISSDLIRTLNGWWASVAGGAVLDRSLLDPVDFKELLPSIGIADVEPEPFRIRFRLVGTRIVDVTGLDYTGKYLDELKPPAPGEPWMDEYRLACQSRRPLFGASTVMTRHGTRHTYEFAILPLRKGGEDIAQVIALEDHFGYQSAKMDLPPWKIGGRGAPLS